MEKLFKYLMKLGLTESTSIKHYRDESPALFYRETYGDRSYFKNAPNYTYEGAVIVLDYNVEATPDFFRKQKALERMIEKYCKRYGYTFNSKYFYGDIVITATRQDYRETADSYFYFRDKSVEECDQKAHELYTAGRDAEVNSALGEIMEQWGNAYNDFLADQQKIRRFTA